MIRVLVQHDQCLWRTALVRGLAGEQDITFVAHVNHGEDLVAAVLRAQPDVLILDGGLLPSDHAAKICATFPDVSVLLLLDACQRTGLQLDLSGLAPRVGFMTTGDDFERFIEAIHRLMRGEAVIDSGLALAVMKARENPLTRREREVLRHLLSGATTREIAETLFLSVGTVRNYLSNAIHKSGARSRMDAVRIAQEAGWI